MGARPSTPKPFGFQFAPEDVQDRNGVPLSGKELRVQVTPRTATNAVIATGSASSELRYVSPEGWYCKEELAARVSFGAGPVVAVEFQSASHLVGVEVRLPNPSCPSPTT
jgi:pyruvate/2-oxoglutarate dehydrogenase complex dihydrolipoamide dehydrogenase (E3) component